MKAMIDPEEMGMVIRNLFENAVLYSPQSPEISVKLIRTGTWLQLTVQDRGRGLDGKELKKVFDRFYRAQPPGDNVRGTGLGLYIVQSVINGYGGTVKVSSDGSGKGCTFTLKFPAAQVNK
ncbi:MAG: ATP-binding protein, partial [Desulfuromonadaceae bacterium]|nr:ATP-binding protein [Desulfuromonadaceae bacterium]